MHHPTMTNDIVGGKSISRDLFVDSNAPSNNEEFWALISVFHTFLALETPERIVSNKVLFLSK
jgi:hypothetical protein